LSKQTQNKIIIRLPPPHSGGQEIFLNWNKKNPDAQCLVAPAATKVGKTFGSSLWILTEALSTPNMQCYWIAPSYLKCNISFRYIWNFLPRHEWIKPLKSKLEYHFANGSFIKFLHGRDAETVIEGENIDRFVIDETSKVDKQVWLSLLTTITQTRGRGIVTGTPRGFNWYYDIFKKAQDGDPFFVWVQLKTIDSPFVSKEAVEIAKRLLPNNLYLQYYEAVFTTVGSLFGDLTPMWDDAFQPMDRKHWIHPDPLTREGEIVHGIDVAKKKDYTVIYSVNMKGQLVGFVRVRHFTYPVQVNLIKTYLTKFFIKSENIIRYDSTGVGEAFGDILSDANINADITPVLFTNRSKSEMLTKTLLAIQSGWHKAPLIRAIKHEFTIYEIVVSKFGNHKYSAPEGEHDDVVSAAMIALSYAYDAEKSGAGYELLEAHFKDGPSEEDIIEAYQDNSEIDELFNESSDQEEFDFDEDSNL